MMSFRLMSIFCLVTRLIIHSSTPAISILMGTKNSTGICRARRRSAQIYDIAHRTTVSIAQRYAVTFLFIM